MKITTLKLFQILANTMYVYSANAESDTDERYRIHQIGISVG
jgi:hypothetical protein